MPRRQPKASGSTERIDIYSTVTNAWIPSPTPIQKAMQMRMVGPSSSAISHGEDRMRY
jgi:hypothetical protein